MQRLKSGKSAIGLPTPQARASDLFVEKRAVEMPSYDQPVYANRRAHRLLTGLGKLARQGCLGILKVAGGEFTTVPQPRLRFGKKEKKGDVSKKRMSLDPNGPVGVA